MVKEGCLGKTTSSKLTPQEELIGKHPSKPNIFGIWFDHEDLPFKKGYKHRKLEELKGGRKQIIDPLANLVITHHKSEDSIRLIRETILTKRGLAATAKKKKFLPTNYFTRKGNLTEIILTEYLLATSGYSLLVYRLRYNNNIDQSLKGDDVLLFDLRNTKKIKTILGEAKYRSAPSRKVIEDILNAMNKDKLPLSLEFVIEKLSLEGKNDLAQLLTELSLDEIGLKNRLTYVGLLFSNSKVHKEISKHSSKNNDFVFLSIGFDDAGDFILEIYKAAKNKIIKRIR